MTDSSKKNAIQYLLGKLDTTPSLEDVEFNEYDKNQNDLQTELSTTYFPYGYTMKGIVQGNTSNGDGLEYSVVYGIYDNQAHTQVKGFMVILDEQYNIVQVITEYSNEEDFGNILALNVGNDGRFYMVELDGNGYYRFVLLNNILAKLPDDEEYQVVQRQTYRFPNQTIIAPTGRMLITKHPQDARYLITQLYNEYDEDGNMFFAIEFVINVGSENEWNVYNTRVASFQLISTIEIDDLLASWDENNNLLFKATIGRVNVPFVSYIEIVKNADSDTLVTYGSNVEWGENVFDFAQSIIKNFDISYLSTSKTENGITTYKIYKTSGNNYTLISTFNNVNVGSYKGVRLAKNQNDIFFTYQDTDTYVGLIVGENVYTSTFSNFSSSISDTLFFVNVQKTFNLYTMYVQSGDYNNFAKLIYIDETNNQQFVDETCLTPYYGTLYDSNDKLIYARTLYNKSIVGQLTTSTIQVSNLFLNNISIEGEKLFGKSYCELYDNTETFTKNEYEELYVNFANTWYMENRNDPNNIIFNTPGASRFNQSITGVNDYILERAVKYRLNFSNDTTYINTFNSSQITQIDNVAPWTHRYTWTVYNPTTKNILSIDIMSWDEATIYQTISNLNFASGKAYTLTQDVYVL